MAYTADVSTSEFGRLNQLYNGGGNTDPGLISTPLWFVRGGLIDGTLRESGGLSDYWSSTIANDKRSYYLEFKYNKVSPSFYDPYGYGYRGVGRSLRCLAR